MSAECSGYVWRFSPYKGATFAVHHALGDIANDAHGYELWTSNGEAADKARITRKAAHAAFKQLLDDGFLTRLGVGAKGIVRYRFNMPQRAPIWTPSALRERVTTGDTDDAQQVTTGDTLLSPDDTARVTTGDTNTNNTTVNSTSADEPKLVAREIASGYYDWAKERNGGVTVNWNSVRAVVLGALKRDCEALDIKRALVVLYERGRMQPTTSMLVEEVVVQMRKRIEAGDAPRVRRTRPPRGPGQPKRCTAEPDCDALLIGDGSRCAEEHEQRSTR